jgi:spore maturation protein CgeB
MTVFSLDHIALQKAPRILLVGDYMWPWYQEACARGLESLGCEVFRFGWFDDFRHWVPDHTEPIFHSIFHRIQYRIQSGPTVSRVNQRLLQAALEVIPDIVWFYNVKLVSSTVVSKLRALLPMAVFCQYSNDNPFSKIAKPGLWSNYLDSIKYFDLHFAFRYSNFSDYYQRGATNVRLLRAYFIPEDDYPVSSDQIPLKFKCDVVFAGHYEDDGRVQMLEAICEAGYTLNLFGGGWDQAFNQLSPDSHLRAKYPIMPATNEDYRYSICGAKVALCFLSTLNCDTYTRRNFQIPAMQTVMLSQYTDDLATLYKPDVDAVFFKNKSQMLEQLKLMLEDDRRRHAISLSGYDRVYSQGHDVKTRMREFLSSVVEWASQASDKSITRCL